MHVILSFIDLLVSILGILAIFGPPIYPTIDSTFCEISAIVYVILLWSFTALLAWCTTITLFLYLSRKKAGQMKFHKVSFYSNLIVVSKSMEETTAISCQKLSAIYSKLCDWATIGKVSGTDDRRCKRASRLLYRQQSFAH